VLHRSSDYSKLTAAAAAAGGQQTPWITGQHVHQHGHVPSTGSSGQSINFLRILFSSLNLKLCSCRSMHIKTRKGGTERCTAT